MDNVENKKSKREPWSLFKAFCMGLFIFSIPLYLVIFKRHISGFPLAALFSADITYTVVYLLTKTKNLAKSNKIWLKSNIINIAFGLLTLAYVIYDWNSFEVGSTTLVILGFTTLHVIITCKLWKPKEVKTDK